ncbi:MAG: VOC family protein [Actinomycetota bacterium]
MIPSRVSFATIGAIDLPGLRAFYNALGWKESPISQDSFVAFEMGGAVLALYGLEALAEEAHLPPPVKRESFRGITLSVNVEQREDVDSSLASARDAGAKILREPRDADWGGRSAHFADPEGNVWEIAWLPGSTFDNRGSIILP